jgi:hypothetical protein
MPTETKEEALALLEYTRADWIADARRLATDLYKRVQRPITVREVENLHPVPKGFDARVLGAVFNKASGWECIGEIPVSGYPKHKGHDRQTSLKLWKLREK